MGIIQILGVGIVAIILAIMLKQWKPEMAIILSLFAGVCIILLTLSKLSTVLDVMKSFAERVGFDSEIYKTLLKVIGISYLAELGIDLCKDAGEAAIASKIELAAKIFIVFISLPIFTTLIETIDKITQ